MTIREYTELLREMRWPNFWECAKDYNAMSQLPLDREGISDTFSEMVRIHKEIRDERNSK